MSKCKHFRTLKRKQSYISTFSRLRRPHICHLKVRHSWKKLPQTITSFPGYINLVWILIPWPTSSLEAETTSSPSKRWWDRGSRMPSTIRWRDHDNSHLLESFMSVIFSLIIFLAKKLNFGPRTSKYLKMAFVLCFYKNREMYRPIPSSKVATSHVSSLVLAWYTLQTPHSWIDLYAIFSVKINPILGPA